eukprot:scaffold13644_cov117-Isochrysis_galbana.AAC.6
MALPTLNADMNMPGNAKPKTKRKRCSRLTRSGSARPRTTFGVHDTTTQVQPATRNRNPHGTLDPWQKPGWTWTRLPATCE